MAAKTKANAKMDVVVAKENVKENAKMDVVVVKEGEEKMEESEDSKNNNDDVVVDDEVGVDETLDPTAVSFIPSTSPTSVENPHLIGYVCMSSEELSSFLE